MPIIVMFNTIPAQKQRSLATIKMLKNRAFIMHISLIRAAL